MDRFLQFFNYASDAVALINTKGDLLYRNEKFIQTFPDAENSGKIWQKIWERIPQKAHYPISITLPEGREIIVYKVYNKAVGKNPNYFLLIKDQGQNEEGMAADKEEDPFPDELEPEFRALVGEDPHFRRALFIAQRAAKSDLPVLIMGESGTGKEILARAIHRTSRRCDKELVDVNCAAIPDSLIESELFGYERGAFTGARKEGRIGYFDLAHGGTIFLDEIGDASLQAQSKLLRVLEDGCFKRVGGNKNVTVDVRIISATNQDLRKLIAEKTFREDLYYRLNTFTIELPPLRERKGDIPLLVEHFLAQCEGDQKRMRFLPSTMEILLAYDWPGNVRELKGVVNYAVNMSPSRLVTPQALPRFLFSPTSTPHQQESKEITGGDSLPGVLREVERALIKEALERSPNKSAAIRRLGISRRTFYQKLKEYHLE